MWSKVNLTMCTHLQVRKGGVSFSRIPGRHQSLAETHADKKCDVPAQPSQTHGGQCASTAFRQHIILQTFLPILHMELDMWLG